jgi:adenylosuccinate lyase
MIRVAGWLVAALVCAGMGSAVGALAQPVDGKGVFAHRVDVMKQLGKPFYLVLRRVAKGTTPYGPDTVAAAEEVQRLAPEIAPALFTAGSDVGGSKIKPEIFGQPERVASLTRAVQETVARLTAAAKSGDQAAMAAAYDAANDACMNCHNAFRVAD